MTVKVEVEGVGPLIEQLKTFEDSAITRTVNKAAADVVLNEADSTAPEQSGGLRGSGRTSGTKTAGVVRYGNARNPQARNVHFGDIDRPQGGFTLPNPWVYEAADARREEVFETYRDHVDRLARRF